MRLKAVRNPVVALLLLVTTAPAWAWNDTGHMVCAQIAWQELKPAARDRISALLKSHPRYAKDLLADMPDGYPDPAQYAFLKAATWPDQVRNLQNPMSRTHHHGNWHYADFPFVPSGDPAKFNPPIPREEGGTIDNILKALPKAVADLKNPATPDSDKAISLCWVAHLVGDIHQPLHAASLFSEEYPNGDKGGNLILVTRSSGETTTLHAEWDNILGPFMAPRAVEFMAQEILANPRCTRTASEPVMAEHASYKSWAMESFDAARDFAYLGGKLQGSKPGAPARTTQPAGPPALPVSYEEVARRVAEHRIALAGHRLADQLNELFGQ